MPSLISFDRKRVEAVIERKNMSIPVNMVPLSIGALMWKIQVQWNHSDFYVDKNVVFFWKGGIRMRACFSWGEDAFSQTQGQKTSGREVLNDCMWRERGLDGGSFFPDLITF